MFVVSSMLGVYAFEVKTVYVGKERLGINNLPT